MAPAHGLRLLAGLVGPAAFTAAWAWAARQQEDYSVPVEHISGLAAPDARRPLVMVAGFLAFGVCATAFAAALEDSLGGRGDAGAGPDLIRAGGGAAIAAGLLRRDRMLLDPPGHPVPASWRNDGHDTASAVAYTALVAAPVALARRFAHDPEWDPLRRPAVATSAVTGGLLALFASRVAEPWNGIVQRVAVSVPGIGMLLLAGRLTARRVRSGGPRRPVPEGRPGRATPTGDAETGDAGTGEAGRG